MNKLVKFGGHVAALFHNISQKAQALVLAAAVGLAAMVGNVEQAYATPTTLTGAATSKLTSAESDITSILIILVGVIFLFVLYALIKKAK